MTPDERFAYYSSGAADSDGCINYTGTINRDGYGEFWVFGKRVMATRWVWEKTHGKISPENLHVCHKCDNPACVNIDHLFLGTCQANVLDKVEKNRQYMILSPQQVIDIFDEVGSYDQIAEKYGVHKRTVQDILWGKTRHTKDNEEFLSKAEAGKLGRRMVGESRHNSKLKDFQVVAIFHDPRTYREIAEEYGVVQATVHGIKKGKRWKHVTSQIPSSSSGAL